MKIVRNSECGAILMLALSCGFWISDGTGIIGEELSEKGSVYSNIYATTEVLFY